MGPVEVAPTAMVSTRASDKEGVRVAALALLEGPNTVVCSSEPVHSLSQSSVVAEGSSSQLSVGVRKNPLQKKLLYREKKGQTKMNLGTDKARYRKHKRYECEK